MKCLTDQLRYTIQVLLAGKISAIINSIPYIRIGLVVINGSMFGL